MKNNSWNIPHMADPLEFSSKPSKKNGCFLGQRHIVALIAFLCCFLISANRLVLSVGIVAMVKHRETNETKARNSTEISCPLLSSPPKAAVQSSFQGEFSWSSELQGYLLGVGFLSWLLMQAPAGRLADAVGLKPLVVYSNALAGLFVMISPFAARWHAYALITVQFLRGAVQGIVTPAIFKMLSNWIPRNERATLNSSAVSGYTVGIAIGGVVTGWLCDIPGLGWPSAFYTWGIICFLKSVVTHFIFFEHPVKNPWITDEELKYINDGLENTTSKSSEKRLPTPWKKIFTSIPCYAYFYGLTGHLWGLSYFITVHPTYMGTILHYSKAEAGLTSCLPLLITTLSGILTSIISHWASKKNWISLNHLRKTTTGVSALGFSLCMAGIILAGCDAKLNVLSFALSLFSLGIAVPGIMISGVDMSPTFAGSVMGIASTIAGVGNFLLPVITGLLTPNETLSEWQMVFWINLIVVGSSGLVYVLFGSADVQPWNFPEEEHPDKNTEEKTKYAEKNCNQLKAINENLEIQRT